MIAIAPLFTSRSISVRRVVNSSIVVPPGRSTRPISHMIEQSQKANERHTSVPANCSRRNLCRIEQAGSAAVVATIDVRPVSEQISWNSTLLGEVDLYRINHIRQLDAQSRRQSRFEPLPQLVVGHRRVVVAAARLQAVAVEEELEWSRFHEISVTNCSHLAMIIPAQKQCANSSAITAHVRCEQIVWAVVVEQVELPVRSVHAVDLHQTHVARVAGERVRCVLRFQFDDQSCQRLGHIRQLDADDRRGLEMNETIMTERTSSAIASPVNSAQSAPVSRMSRGSRIGRGVVSIKPRLNATNAA